MTAQISIANARKIEADGYMSFTVTLSEPASSAGVSIDYRTVQGTATGDLDYDGASGTLQIAAGGTSGTISIYVRDDAIDETDENFYIQLSNPTGAFFPYYFPLLRAIGTIEDND